MTESLLGHSVVTGTSEPSRWLYLLHGIYGSGRNWGSLARRLVEDRPEWGIVLTDLRLHGSSNGFSPPHTIEACAADVVALEQRLERPADALLGHSFGGKVALVRATWEAQAITQIWVVDSTLRVGEPAGSPWDIIGIVRSQPPIFESRDQLADVMVEHGYARPVGQWLAMNLVRGQDGFRWKLDWDGVEAMLRDYFATDVWPVVEDPPSAMEIHVVRAEDSTAVDAEAAARLERAGERTERVHLHTIAGGHWVNVDNPEGMLDLLRTSLPH